VTSFAISTSLDLRGAPHCSRPTRDQPATRSRGLRTVRGLVLLVEPEWFFAIVTSARTEELGIHTPAPVSDVRRERDGVVGIPNR